MKEIKSKVKENSLCVQLSQKCAKIYLFNAFDDSPIVTVDSYRNLSSHFVLCFFFVSIYGLCDNRVGGR